MEHKEELGKARNNAITDQNMRYASAVESLYTS